MRQKEDMAVRKRKWLTKSGAEKEAWVVDYADAKGVRRLKTFARKKEADSFAATANVEIREGIHVADSASATVKQAGDFWISTATGADLEKSTTDQYQQHLDLHIDPFIGDMKLSALTIPAVRSFEDSLREGGRSPAMVRKVLISLGSLLADAQERGLTPRNAVRDMRGKRRKGTAEKRQKGKLKIGKDIPTKDEIKAFVNALEGKWRPMLLTAVFTGMRASELRGLSWLDVDIERHLIHVRQRADRFNKLGQPKSEAGERTIPIPPMVNDALKAWKAKCPKGDQKLVFPNGNGNVESLANIINRGLGPSLVKAGVSVDSGKKDEQGNIIFSAKYPGMHALRHFYASWCINSVSDGGLGLAPKVVQERLGHATIAMTMDTYGHLFPRGDERDEMAKAERALLD